MFPTTVWTDIEQAAERDADALQSLGERYRAPVFAFLLSRGLEQSDADDVCQDVFARLLSQDVFARADAGRGRFRNLLLTVTWRAAQDAARGRRDLPAFDDDATDHACDFDRAWIVHLAERAMARLRRLEPDRHAIIAAHLTGEPQERRRLWRARRRLSALVREEVAYTCRTEEELRDELSFLSPWLNSEKGGDTAEPSSNTGRQPKD